MGRGAPELRLWGPALGLLCKHRCQPFALRPIADAGMPFDFEYTSEMPLSAGFSELEKSRPSAGRLYPGEALALSEKDPGDLYLCLYVEVFSPTRSGV
jgi:hypothetical protein